MTETDLMILRNLQASEERMAAMIGSSRIERELHSLPMQEAQAMHEGRARAIWRALQELSS